MTYPVGDRPDGAYAMGGRYGQDVTEESAIATATGGVRGSYVAAQNQHRANVSTPLAAQAGSINNHETRITTLENGGTMTTYGGNGTYTVPDNGRIGVGVFCGGQAGVNGFQTNSPTTPSITHGGYQYQEFNCEDLPSTVAITVGAGGASAGQLGGVSSFGSYLVGVPGVAGSIQTVTGFVGSSSTPGTGGSGGGSNGTAGSAGTSTPLATGGAYVTSGAAGGNGGSVPIGTLTPCGGAGGGGAKGSQAFGVTPGAGGAGGAPGGCGGGGGCSGSLNNTAFSPGGAGGAGRVHILWTPGAVT